MKIIALGSGTSQGIPVIGCDCATCLSSDPKDKRLRSSVHISTEKAEIQIDIGPDFRYQYLSNRIISTDLILVTHEHNDHIIGLDDIRAINFIQKKTIPLYAELRVLHEIKKRFPYAFSPDPYPGLPRLELKELDGLPFQYEDILITPVRVMHGNLPIYGFRLNNFGYITDASQLDDKAISQLYGVDVLIINALRHTKHYSHFNLEECIGEIKRINPKKAYITHISHMMGPTKEWSQKLPENIFPLEDKMVINL